MASAKKISELDAVTPAVTDKYVVEPTAGVAQYSTGIFLPTYTVATVPSAVTYVRRLIYVSDEAGGAQPAFSDGTNWRRFTDRAVVS